MAYFRLYHKQDAKREKGKKCNEKFCKWNIIFFSPYENIHKLEFLIFPLFYFSVVSLLASFYEQFILLVETAGCWARHKTFLINCIFLHYLLSFDFSPTKGKKKVLEIYFN